MDAKLPAGHTKPTSQGPLQPDEVRPGVEPYLPAGHKEHTAAPAALHRPGEHWDHAGVESFVPARQTKPAAQGPSHEDFCRAIPEPYRPASQSVQTAAPVRLYRPAGHTTCSADVDPGGHAYPALQLPEQLGEVNADVAPCTPSGHTEHVLAPAKLKVPGPQRTAVELEEPAGQMYPALQFPEQAGVDSAGEAP